MNKRFRVAAFVVFAVAVTAVVQTVVLADHHEKKAKHTIEQVMEMAHKEGLLKKVASGQGEMQDKLKLLDLYISLVENKPPKGDMESWHQKAGAVALAAAKVAVGREGSMDELKTATNCKGCHQVHKGD